MALRRLGDKPLSEATIVRLLTHICVTRPQLVKWTGLLAHFEQYSVNTQDMYSQKCASKDIEYKQIMAQKVFKSIYLKRVFRGQYALKWNVF